MLKFWRKIRQKLIKEGNLKRYLAYAIGEILLVMIGILLALQVNNWNENKKARNIEFQALSNLKQEFERNNSEFMRIQTIRKKALIDLHNHLDFIISTEKVTHGNLNNIRPEELGVQTWNLANPILDGLTGNGTITIISNDSLKYLLTSWKYIAENYTEQQDLYVNKMVLDFWEYEKSRVPRPMPTGNDYITPKGGYKYYSEEQMASYYAEIIKELEYINNIKACIQQLTVVRYTGQGVENLYSKIEDLLNAELVRFER